MQDKLSVYFDGLCHLCSREINHYKKMNGAEKIRFIDITAADFNPQLEQLDPVQIHKVMHVRDRAGRLHLGVDAFLQIWLEFPLLKRLVPIARFWPIYWVLRAFYAIFAKIRPLLPKKSCETSPYCER
jgi:predicted DCC family thiol-disulfide oxidoreductase YuxK